MHSDADHLGETKGGKPVSSVDDRLMDTNQPAREGSGIFIRSQKVRDRAVSRPRVRIPQQRSLLPISDGGDYGAIGL